MGRQKKGKAAGGGSHNHNKNKNSSYVEFEVSEEKMMDLVTEATQLHVLLNERHQKIKKNTQFVNILSTKWLLEWKQYVGYQNLFGNEKQQSKKTGKKRPSLPNADLTQLSKDGYEIPEQLEQYQYLNKVIKNKLEKDQDFIPVTKDIWDSFNSIYGPGEQIMRPCRLNKYNRPYIDFKLMQLDCIFVDWGDENVANKLASGKVGKNELDKVLLNKKVQVSTLWKLQDLYQFFQKLCLVDFNSNEVTLWQGYNFVPTRQIKEQLIKPGKSDTVLIYAQKLEIEKVQDLDIDDFIKQVYTIIVQIGGNKIKSGQMPQQIHGYCEECVQKKSLKYCCVCQLRFYCSQNCRVDDQIFHFNICKKAFQNKEDEDYNKLKLDGNRVTQSSVCGLKNLGNTCYMNSVLQSFLGFGFLTDLLCSNAYKNKISQKQKNAEMFLDSVSRFCKRMSEKNPKQCLQPWDIKSKVNYFLNPFQGYKQHDALDFMMAFLNTINDCFAKNQQDAYHTIFYQNIVGLYDSLIICPNCSNQATNTEPFIQLTLPIKTKVKKNVYDFAIFHSPFSIQHGKAEVKIQWNQIKSDLGVADDCLMFIGGDGETGLTDVDTDSSTENCLKKCKKQLLFYPFQKVKQSDYVFSANMIVMKQLSGMNMKANSGYPIPVILNKTKTNGHFFIDLIRLLNLEKGKDELLEQILAKYRNIQQQKELKDQHKSQKATENKKSTMIEETAQIQAKQLNTELVQMNNTLSCILQDLNLEVYIVDLKKIKNICFFCKRKCESCIFEPDFRVKAEDCIGMKVGEVRFFIHLTPKLEQNKLRQDRTSSGDSNVFDCLNLFSEPQTLDEENAWYCPSCEDMQLAFKQLRVCQYPKYLILQLARFKNGHNGKVKNNEPIIYGEIQNFGNNKYRLFTVIIHEGSIDAGHYWAICWRKDGYYIFNDQKFTKTDKICNKNAYILCYEMIEEGKQNKEAKVQIKKDKIQEKKKPEEDDQVHLIKGKEKKKNKAKQND